MASRGLKIRLGFKLPDGSADGVQLSVPCNLVGIKSTDLYEPPKVVRRDRKGLAVKTVSVLKSALAKGKVESATGLTTRAEVNEAGELVRDEECRDFLITNDGEVEVEALDPNIGGGKQVDIIKYVDQSKRDDWFVSKTFEVTCSEDDNPMLYKLAEFLDKEGKMALIDIVERESFEKSVGMVVPIVDKTQGKWTLMVFATKAKVDPLWKPIPTAEALAEAKEAKSKKKKGKEIKALGADDLFK